MSSDACDVAVVGGGPAGLAAAIAAAVRGLAVVVIERRELPADKACGESLLPSGVRALEQLGIDPYLTGPPPRRLTGIYVRQEDGSSAEAILPGGGGLGIRRLALVEAMVRRARTVGVTIRAGTGVSRVERGSAGAIVHTSSGDVHAELVVAADGLESALRRDAGLDAPPRARRRLALRQHFAIPPWTDMIEVHVDRLGEAIVTPVSDDSVNVGFVWERGGIGGPTIEGLLVRFPELHARLAGAPALSAVRGAGPMACRAVRPTAARLVLLGDAAGFIDPISADGLSIAFNEALILAEHLPRVLAREATAASLRGYERAARRLVRGYAATTHGLLWIARHPRCRTTLIHYLERHPGVCRAMLGGAMHLMFETA
jgi:flavin-dependent dehydrogenase